MQILLSLCRLSKFSIRLPPFPVPYSSIIPNSISTAPFILNTQARHNLCASVRRQLPDFHCTDRTIRQRNPLIREISRGNRIRSTATSRRLREEKLFFNLARGGEGEGTDVSSEIGLVSAVGGPEVRS